MIDRAAYDNAAVAIQYAEDAVAALWKLKGFLEIEYSKGVPVGGMIDAVSDCIGTIEVEKMESEETRKDYRNASNKLFVE